MWLWGLSSSWHRRFQCCIRALNEQWSPVCGISWDVLCINLTRDLSSLSDGRPTAQGRCLWKSVRFGVGLGVGVVRSWRGNLAPSPVAPTLRGPAAVQAQLGGRGHRLPCSFGPFAEPGASSSPKHQVRSQENEIPEAACRAGVAALESSRWAHALPYKMRPVWSGSCRREMPALSCRLAQSSNGKKRQETAPSYVLIFKLNVEYLTDILNVRDKSPDLQE